MPMLDRIGMAAVRDVRANPARSWIAATLGMGLRIVFSNFLKMTFRGGCSNCGFPKRFFRDRNKRDGLFHTAHGKSR